MTITQFLAFLDATGIPSEQWIAGDKLGLNCIVLNADGNEYISDITKYYFDLDNELILVKEYYYKKDVGKTYITTQVSKREADYFIDINNVTGFIVGKPLYAKPDPLTSFLYNK